MQLFRGYYCQSLERKLLQIALFTYRERYSRSFCLTIAKNKKRKQKQKQTRNIKKHLRPQRAVIYFD